MGQDIQSGHTYSDTESGREVTADNLNDHVNGAVIKETFLSAKPSKGTPQLSDQLLLTDGVLRKTSLQAILAIFQPDGFLANTPEGRAKMADGFLSADTAGRAKMAAGFIMAAALAADVIHGQTVETTLANADEFLFWDDSATALRKITRENLMSQITQTGAVVATVGAEYDSYLSILATPSSNLIPQDNSAPGSTEGTELLTAAITPKATANKILVSITVHMVPASAVAATAALFRNNGASAISVGNLAGPTQADGPATLTFHYLDSPASTSEQTYKVRVGATSGILYVNGIAAGQRYGGCLKSTLLLQEIKG